MKKFNKVSELLSFAIEHGIIYANDGTEIHFDDDTPTAPILVVSKEGVKDYAELLKLKWSDHKPFEHLQLVWAWDDSDVARRNLRVWNSNKYRVFAYDGTGCYSFQYYAPYTGQIEPWMQEMIENCK